MRIGFVGAGLMGAPMVRRLVEAGHDVVVSSRSPERLAGEGWKVVPTPSEAADGAEVVCSVVPDSPEVEAVVREVIPAMVAGGVIVEMSTHAPAVARALAAEAEAAGVAYLDAPVSGGPTGAAAGTLAIWVGGDVAAMERARPVLEVLGAPEKLRHCGPSGSGLVVKLANNYLGAVNAAASAEAVAMARAEGVDPETLIASVMQGSGANWQLGNLFPSKVLRGDFEPGFKIEHMAKDVRHERAVAGAHGVAQPVGQAAFDRLLEALERFGEGVDYGSVARLHEPGPD